MVKPLVSMCMPCYNRQDYIREALQGALDQTYDPLEIVISDNCSTDDTPKIVQEMIDAYKRKGGAHTFVFNRNPVNIGGGKNIAKTFELAHGELLVPAHDDDISLPTRVEKIVAAWEASGRKATVIGHDVYHCDAKGRVFEIYQKSGPHNPCSAIHSYSRKFFEFQFEPFDENEMIEDLVYQLRAIMLGEYVKIDEPLMLYRKEVGISSVSKNWRKIAAQLNRGSMAAFAQIYKDLEKYKAEISLRRYGEVKSIVDNMVKAYKYQDMLFAGESVAERLEGFRHCHMPFLLWSPGTMSYLFVQLLSIVPTRATDSVIDVVMRLKQVGHKRKCLRELEIYKQKHNVKI